MISELLKMFTFLVSIVCFFGLLGLAGCAFMLPIWLAKEALMLKFPRMVPRPVTPLWEPPPPPTPVPAYSSPAPKPVKRPKPPSLNVKGATVIKGDSQPKRGYIHADENIGNRFLTPLKARGYNVTHSRTVGLAGASDEDNLAFAYGERRVLLSFDGDYLILDHKNLPHAGILRLPQGVSPEAVVELYRSHWG